MNTECTEHYKLAIKQTCRESQRIDQTAELVELALNARAVHITMYSRVRQAITRRTKPNTQERARSNATDDQALFEPALWSSAYIQRPFVHAQVGSSQHVLDRSEPERRFRTVLCASRPTPNAFKSTELEEKMVGFAVVKWNAFKARQTSGKRAIRSQQSKNSKTLQQQSEPRTATNEQAHDTDC